MREYRYQLVFEGKVTPDDELGARMMVEARAGFSPKTDPIFSEGAPQAILSTVVENEDESTFTQSGELIFGGGSLRIETIGSGELRPSGDEAVQIGLATWSIQGGTGAFEGARGYVQSLFTINEDAVLVDSQSGIVFVA